MMGGGNGVGVMGTGWVTMVIMNDMGLKKDLYHDNDGDHGMDVYGYS